MKSERYMRPPLQRILERTDTASSGCWNWQGPVTPAGYALLKIDGNMRSLHRVMYTLSKGPIPEGEGWHGVVVMHTCDNIKRESRCW